MTKLYHFDDTYVYNNYVLVNELYEDDDGFNKNWYQWGILNDDEVENLQTLTGLSSNSYASFTEAINVFKEKVNALDLINENGN